MISEHVYLELPNPTCYAMVMKINLMHWTWLLVNTVPAITLPQENIFIEQDSRYDLKA